MSTATAPFRSRPDRRRRAYAWRWVAVFVAVTILHMLAAGWIERHHSAPPPVVHVPLQVALLKPQRIERAAPPAARGGAAQKPAPHPVRPAAQDAHALHAITPPQPHPKVPAEQAASAPAASDTAASSVATASANPASQADAAAGNGQTPGAPTPNASHGAKFSIPPSGDLQYDTFYNGVRNQPGTIHWMSDGTQYEMVVSVPLPFVGTFSWTSRGHVDAFGLAPDQYIEKRGHRTPDVTTFNRSAKQIQFTRTTTTLALPDAAQDRFSMVMQLASLVRGDPDAYRPGVTREFYVADNDSGEIWPVMTIGDETVQTDHGNVTARHFMRMPRRAGDKRRIDVWLAPSLGWLPVRLVQTEPDGNEFELLWRDALRPPGSTDADTNAQNTASADAASAAVSSPVTEETPAQQSSTQSPSLAPPLMPSAPDTTPGASDSPMHP